MYRWMDINMDRKTYVQNFSLFYRTLSPLGAAPLKGNGGWGEGEEGGGGISRFQLNARHPLLIFSSLSFLSLFGLRPR